MPKNKTSICFINLLINNLKTHHAIKKIPYAMKRQPIDNDLYLKEAKGYFSY